MGTPTVLSGDFKQTAPVTLGADRKKALAEWITNCGFWHCDRGEHFINHERFAIQMRQPDPAFDAFIQRSGAGTLELDPAWTGSSTARTLPRTVSSARLQRACGSARRSSDTRPASTRPSASLSLPQQGHDLTGAGATAACESAVMCVSNSRVNSVTERVTELVMKESDPQRTQSHGCTGATSLRTSAGEDALDGVGVSNDYLESLQETEVPPHKMTT